MNPHLFGLFLAAVLPFTAAYYNKAEPDNNRFDGFLQPVVTNGADIQQIIKTAGVDKANIFYTAPLKEIVFNQPGIPVAHISSGPSTVVRGPPIFYKLRPQTIYQNEIINKVPTPLSLNPVYVKVFNPGEQGNKSPAGTNANSGNSGRPY